MAKKTNKLQKKKTNKSTNKTIKNTLSNNKNYKTAEKLYKDKQYEEAYNIYLNLLNEYPKNKKIYKRLLDTLTKDYTHKDNTKEFKRAFDDYITTYKILASKKELEKLDTQLENYKTIKSSKNGSKFLLIALLGPLGIHKFLEKKYVIGVIYLLTFGIFGLGVIYDLINDYAEYENELYLTIYRYIISLVLLIFALINRNTINVYYLVLIAIIIMPYVYDKLLKLIPNIIKIVGIIVLCFFTFKQEVVVDYIPNHFIGTWKTENESTNYKELIIKKDKTTIKFNDRDDETGINEYDKDTKILKVYISANNFYKFKIDEKDKKLCSYSQSETCIISFKK